MAHVAWNEIGEGDLQAMATGNGLLAGQPVPEVDLRVVPDQFGEPIGPFTLDEFAAASLPVDEIGEIVVTGDHVLKGYLQGEGDSETKFEVEGTRWHRTGDAGFFDQQGRLWLVGRCSARINDDKGLLYPFVVECAADFIQGVGRSAMVSYKGRRVLLLETNGSLDQDSIRERLAWAELDEVRVVEQIPMDKRHNAKVDYTRVYRLLD
jgi:acyl-CoA synthetase (AMP-forming)/AMP-acid ligase II